MTEKTYSFEFFPPQTEEGAAKLRATRKQLAQLKPAFFSVTYGAGGSTQERTIGTVLEIKSEGLEVAPHVSCVGTSKAKVRELVDRYLAAGISRMVALRGDLPSGMLEAGEFRFASDLVAFIRQEYGSAVHIEVAAYPEYHPQSRSPQDDLRNFKCKVDAGANAAITQYFYNADAYFAFIDECRGMGISVPIIPGVMPITRYSQLARFRIPAAPKSHAGFGASSKATAMICPPSGLLGWMSLPTCVIACCAAGRLDCTSIL
jgi:methylenetetrahydrofolate reductase (NADPH)